MFPPAADGHVSFLRGCNSPRSVGRKAAPLHESRPATHGILDGEPMDGVLGQTGGSSVWFAEVARMDDYRDL